MKKVPTFTLHELVTSNTARGLGALAKLPITGREFLASEPYGSGTAPVITRLPAENGHRRLALAYPAEHTQLTLTVDENGRIVASVCHGYAGLLEATRSDGTPFLSGRTVTGFSWTEEILAGVARKVPFDIEKRVKVLGADYRKSLIPMRSFVERDGLLVTGQNPTSAKATGAELLRTLRENAR